MPINFYIVPALCFKEILVSVSRRWRDNSAEICRSYVKIVSINYGTAHLLVAPALTYLSLWLLSGYYKFSFWDSVPYPLSDTVIALFIIFLSSFRIFPDSTYELAQKLRITKRTLKFNVYIHILIQTTNFS
jgi:hypothetical protein